MRQEPSEQTTHYCDQLKIMRTGGQLREAYQLGKQLHEKFPSDEYIERAFSWVIYDCLKRYKDEKSKFYKDLPAFVKTLTMIPSYGFDPYSNASFFENISKYLIPGIGWDLRLAKDIPALEDFLKRLKRLDANEESNVYGTMLAYLEEPIGALGWDYRKAGDLSGLLGLLKMITSIDSKMASCLREPIIAFGWDCRKANNLDGLTSLLNVIASLGDASACFKNKDALLMFSKGFEPSKNLSDMPAIQSKKAMGIVTLIEWFDLDNLTPDMFREEEYQGKKQQSLAEKLISRYADVLGLQTQDGRYVFDAVHIKRGLDSLAIVLQSTNAQQWIWPQYKYGKLLIQVDGAQKARPFFAKVLLRKWNEPYIWGAFADTFAEYDPVAYAKCLFRGLRISQDIGFSLTLHEKAMLVLKSMQRFAEAKREALTVSDYRRGQGWPESSAVEQQKDQDWFNIEPADNNEDLYLELSAGAEQYVFPYAEKTNFYVEWKDAEKSLMGITTIGSDDTESNPISRVRQNSYAYVPSWAKGLRRTVIKDHGMICSLEVGACYTGVLSQDGRTILGDIESCASEEFANRFTIEFEGTFDLVKYKDKQGNDRAIAFVRDTQRGSIFVPPNLFKNTELVTFDIVQGTARAIFKDERWSMETTDIRFLGKPDPHDIEKEISGEFESTRQSFGFIGDCFVSKSLVFKEKLKDYDRVTVLARKSWDKKKGHWGWAAVKTLKKDSTD